MNFQKILCILSFLLTSCDKTIENKYLSSKITDSSIQDIIKPDVKEGFKKVCHSSVERAEIIPRSLKQEVSLVLNENLSVKSALCEIAKRLNINFQMEPDIDAKIIFHANRKSFIEILDTVCDMADLRLTITADGFVKIVKDTPYIMTYNVQFLNFARDSENKISIATEISSTPTVGIDKHSTQSPESMMAIRTKSDFWEELSENIRTILINQSKDNVKYSINRQSGVITVYANSKIHRSVREYLRKVESAISSQVLIEAKIIEISLKNEYKRGIDWSIISKHSEFKNEFNNIPTGSSVAAFAYNKVGETSEMHNILSALEKFGSMRTISNPRITAMNNQAATLKVAQNHVYFKLNYDKTYALVDLKKEEVAVSSDIKTVPIGLVMFVQPSIDVANKTITLFLRPTITKLAGETNDPAVDIAIRSINSDNKSKYEPSMIPITEVREVASVLKLNDGEIAVLGGFMEVRSSKDKAGVPLLKDMPFIENLVSSYGTGDNVVELVILIKVKIIDGPNTQNAADKRLQRFVPDPRPF